MNSLIYRLTLFFFTLSVLGLYLSDSAKAVPSIAMAGLILCAIVYVIKNGFNNWQYDLIVLSAGMFLLYLLQFITSDNQHYLLERIRIKLPFLLLPLAIMVLPLFKRDHLIKLGLVYIAVTTSVALFITIRFVTHYQYYIELISQSQVVPGPINHIRFSLMTVMAAYLTYFFVHEVKVFSQKSKQYIMYLTLAFLIVFLHIYSVRSGMLALYAVVFFVLVCKLKAIGNWKHWVISGILFCSLPVIAYYSSSALQNKLKATVEDFKLYQENRSNENNSLGKRFVSYEVAFEVFKQNPLMGCGIGDLEDMNKALFLKHHPDVQTVIIPHNQFVYYLMGSGLIGTLLFTFTFFFPLFYHKHYKWSLLSVQYLLLFLSFQTEPMLETQLGVAFSLLFILYAICWIRTSEAEATSDISI